MSDEAERDSAPEDEEKPKNKGEKNGADSEPEEQPPLEPDHQDAVAALQDCGCRLDVDDSGHVWRIFLYDKNGDETLAQIHGLPGLKDVWVIGSKVSKSMVEKFKEQFPNVTIYG